MNTVNQKSKTVKELRGYSNMLMTTWQHMRGIKRYWYLSAFALATLNILYIWLSPSDDTPLYWSPLLIAPTHSPLGWDFRNILLLLLSWWVLAIQYRVSLNQLSGGKGRIIDFFVFDETLGRFLLLQLTLLPISIGMTYVSDLIINHLIQASTLQNILETALDAPLSLGAHVYIVSAVFAIISWLTTSFYAYLSIVLIDQQISPWQSFKETYTNMKNHKKEILWYVATMVIFVIFLQISVAFINPSIITLVLQPSHHAWYTYLSMTLFTIIYIWITIFLTLLLTQIAGSSKMHEKLTHPVSI